MLTDVTIKVSAKDLEVKANAVKGSIYGLETCFRELGEIINRTAYYWIGEAGDRHRRLYNDQQENVSEMIRRLQEHPKDLLAIAYNYEMTESAVEEMANSLAGDIIE